MRKTAKKLIIILLLSFGLALVVLKPLDRTPYSNQAHYQQMKASLNQLADTFPALSEPARFTIGVGNISYAPELKRPLAGYSSRNPNEMTGVLDSMLIKALVINNGKDSLAFLTLDILIIHPLVRDHFFRKTDAMGWNRNNLHLSATHTHSGLGGWAPHYIGKSISGEYDPATVDILSSLMVEVLRKAASKPMEASFSFSEIEETRLVKNRLVGESGKVDPWLKIVRYDTPAGRVLQTFYSAHATCFDAQNLLLSGDYPAVFRKTVENDEEIKEVLFSAGAVGSMGPFGSDERGEVFATHVGETLAEKYLTSERTTTDVESTLTMRSFRLPLFLPDPQVKVGRNIVLRPWVFHQIMGKYTSEISYAQLNDMIWLGIPADYSGELAVPLYAYASSKGLKLIIYSFNGSYIGYVPRDEWYDLDKYETRTMSWYGHDNAAYLSEILRNLIDLSAGK